LAGPPEVGSCGEERERELLDILKSSSWIIDSSVDLLSVNFQYRILPTIHACRLFPVSEIRTVAHSDQSTGNSACSSSEVCHLPHWSN
jgi:hypothetical protein